MKTAAFLSLILVSVLAGQVAFGDGVPFRGIVENATHGLYVEAYSSATHMRVAQWEISSTGNFGAENVKPGLYEVRVVDRNGGTVWNNFVNISTGNQNLVISLPAPTGNRSPAGMVSFNTLTRENGRAMKLLRQSMTSYQRGDVSGAISKLRLAVDDDPSFALAHHGLAIRYLQSGRPSEARNELLKAIEIDPGPAEPYMNLGVADIMLGDPAGAEQAALHALDRAPQSTRARFLRDTSVWKQGRGPKPAQPDVANPLK